LSRKNAKICLLPFFKKIFLYGQQNWLIWALFFRELICMEEKFAKKIKIKSQNLKKLAFMSKNFLFWIRILKTRVCIYESNPSALNKAILTISFIPPHNFNISF